MKKLILSIALLLTSIVFVNAQTAGVLLQPEFNTSNVRKGLFIESTVYKSIGLYSDFKTLKNTVNDKQYNYSQINAGLSFKINKNVKAIATTSVINKMAVDQKHPLKMHGIIKGDYISQERTYQLGVMYKAEFLTVLGGYEFNDKMNNPRVTVGIGFNFNFNY